MTEVQERTAEIDAPAAGREGASPPVSMLVLIVSYRATDLTMDALASLEPEVPTVPRSRVIVCENGTGDGAADTLRAFVEDKGWGHWVEIREVSPNRGFSGGNNVVLEDVMRWTQPPECVLLLNADTVVRPGALRTLHEALDAHPAAGIISPRLEWPDGTPQVSCFRDFHPLTEFDKSVGMGLMTRLLQRYVNAIRVTDRITSPDWTSFACALIRRETLEKVGVLDPGFFLYYDDPDYCRRARRAGYRVVNIPQARVVHLRGRSNPLKTLAKEGKRKPWYHYASRSRYYAKHYGRGGLTAANLFWTLGHVVALTRRFLTGEPIPAVDREAGDIWVNWSDPLVMPRRGQDGSVS